MVFIYHHIKKSLSICEAKSAGMRYNKPALVKTSKNFKNAIKNVLKKSFNITITRIT